ncbi:thioredoxin domain-containing protein [Geothrix limicola]|uniref:Thioredoxin domain-containing protein n=1 Tax=Geothrix limicola TaxID=2927978 RepID=A0ABQ5QHA2_9BACT|nr:thioredoxin domain-containing protein [Geothrix limicola]GLH74052.1 thioredoxin domain-containing protein [Geothrix limicola]
MPNRLSESLSPYLLQHAHNPVDWHPWGEEALAKAKAEQKPIFLSIGYSACHWCHVMERESFENPAVAEVLNAHFVSIKVDREERPDLDDLYMDAVQTLTGRGGWPMSVWLTPDLEPFYGGTYFPPESRGGMPGFVPLLTRIAELWREDRQGLLQQAEKLTAELKRQAEVEAGTERPGPAVLEAAMVQLRRGFDARWGGFGPAPKFPQQMAIDLILARGSAEDQAMARRTLDAMWEGGMYDHLGGGFARYSVDAHWLVPHFEKMLYDNAQLACCYLAAFQATGEVRYAQVARDTLDYLLRDLRDPSGGFHSSEDADSEGEEGKFYAFTPKDVREALGDVDGPRFCEAFGITAGGTFEHGKSVVHRFSCEAGARLPDAEDRALREKLRLWRDRRVRPGKDDKVLAAWNGLALSALARGHQVLGDPRYLEAAQACATFLHRDLWHGGRLLRVWRQGRAHTEGFLEDHAAVMEGLIDLFESDFDWAWLNWAETLGEDLLARFMDPVEGGFFSTEAHQTDLIFRQKPGFDNAIPSGNTLAARALLRLSRHLQREDFRLAAERTLRCFGPWMQRAPRAFLGLLGVVDLTLRDHLDVALSGDPAHATVQEMLREVHRRYLPGRVLSVSADQLLPLHEGRGSAGGHVLAFVCRGHSCAPPVKSARELAGLLVSAPAPM